MRGQDETHGQGVRPEDPEQVGDAEEGGDGLLPGGEGRPRVRGQTVDHQPPLRLPRHHKLGEWKKINPLTIYKSFSSDHEAEIFGVKMGKSRFKLEGDCILSLRDM